MDPGRGGTERDRTGRVGKGKGWTEASCLQSFTYIFGTSATKFLCSFGEANVDGAPTTRHGARVSLPPGPLFRESDRSTLLFYRMITCIPRGFDVVNVSCVLCVYVWTCTASQHPLEHTWTLWFDNPSGRQKQATWGQTLRQVYTFGTVEDFWWYVPDNIDFETPSHPRHTCTLAWSGPVALTAHDLAPLSLWTAHAHPRVP